MREFKPVVLPNSLISTALLLTHDHTGHNVFRRTYAALKQLYYWTGMKKDVLIHCKHCQVCAKQKVEKTKYIKDNFRPSSMPMEFISMDLVGKLSKTSSGHKYALTIICMLTGYMFCIPLKTKTAEEIVDKYLTHVTFTFRHSRKILSDNGTEFKNALFEEVAKQLGVERKIYSLMYRPQANGCIEGFHKLYQITAYNLLKAREHYIKDQTQKHIPQPHLKLGNAVLVRDHTREQFRPRYKDFRITKRLGNARVEVCDKHGKLSVRHISDVKQVTPWSVQCS